jgi:hypothetical protein
LPIIAGRSWPKMQAVVAVFSAIHCVMEKVKRRFKILTTRVYAAKLVQI